MSIIPSDTSSLINWCPPYLHIARSDLNLHFRLTVVQEGSLLRLVHSCFYQMIKIRFHDNTSNMIQGWIYKTELCQVFEITESNEVDALKSFLNRRMLFDDAILKITSAFHQRIPFGLCLSSLTTNKISILENNVPTDIDLLQPLGSGTSKTHSLGWHPKWRHFIAIGISSPAHPQIPPFPLKLDNHNTTIKEIYKHHPSQVSYFADKETVFCRSDSDEMITIKTLALGTLENQTFYKITNYTSLVKQLLKQVHTYFKLNIGLGDIKPGNVNVYPDKEKGLSYKLADLDGSWNQETLNIILPELWQKVSHNIPYLKKQEFIEKVLWNTKYDSLSLEEKEVIRSEDYETLLHYLSLFLSPSITYEYVGIIEPYSFDSSIRDNLKELLRTSFNQKEWKEHLLMKFQRLDLIGVARVIVETLFYPPFLEESLSKVSSQDRPVLRSIIDYAQNLPTTLSLLLVDEFSGHRQIKEKGILRDRLRELLSLMRSFLPRNHVPCENYRLFIMDALFTKDFDIDVIRVKKGLNELQALNLI